jgi:hypothetical protein
MYTAVNTPFLYGTVGLPTCAPLNRKYWHVFHYDKSGNSGLALAVGYFIRYQELDRCPMIGDINCASTTYKTNVVIITEDGGCDLRRWFRNQGRVACPDGVSCSEILLKYFPNQNLKPVWSFLLWHAAYN